MKAHPGGREINDFEYEWANRLAREDLDAALSFVEVKEASETDAYRKSHFGYLKGELLINHEQPAF